MEARGIERHTPEWEHAEGFVKQICINKDDAARALLPELGERADESLIDEIRALHEQLKAEHNQVVAAGGLHIIGSERHESRRIDNQLRGRAGRQGDPGSSRFYLSLEDDLMRIFGSERLVSVMDRLGMSDDAPIEASMVTRAIENAQKRVEGQHFDARKNLLEYDDVMNQQRKTIYAWRLSVLGAEGEALREITLDAIEDLVINLTKLHAAENVRVDDWKVDTLIAEVEDQFGVKLDFTGVPSISARYQERIYFAVEKALKARNAEIESKQPGIFRRIEKEVFLRTIDDLWKHHLQVMDQLRQGIGLRGYGQRDPKKEYQKEGFRLFHDLLVQIKAKVISQLMRVQVRAESEIRAEEEAYRRRVEAMQREMQMSAPGGGEKTEDGPRGPAPNQVLAPPRAPALQRRNRAKIGRNDPCWCGSGKKYKSCHMAADGGNPEGGESESEARL
jgi:preprotein translocase subunit SecA